MAERVVTALSKVSSTSHATPQDQEEALVLWVSKVTAALQERIALQVTDVSSNYRTNVLAVW